jgi:hypothetical protein
MSRPKPSPWPSSPPAGPAASPARRAHPARRPRIPRQRGGRHARLDRRIGQQRPQTSPRQPAAPAAADRQARTGSRPRLTLRAGARGRVRPRLRSGDFDALVALLTDNIHVSMPPIPLEYQGRDAAARLFASIFRSGRRVDLVPTRANGQPAFGAYLRASTGIRHGTGLFALTLTGDRICAFTRFDNSVLPWFGLPRSLPSR